MRPLAGVAFSASRAIASRYLVRYRFQLIARCLGVDLELSELDLIGVARGDGLGLIGDVLLEALHLAGGDARVLLEAVHALQRRLADFVVEAGELAREFLHPGMAGQQRAAEFGDLRFQRDARLRIAAQRVRPLATEPTSSRRPVRTSSFSAFALAVAAPSAARAVAICALISDNCCEGTASPFGPASRPDCARSASTRPSAVATLHAQRIDLLGQPFGRRFRFAVLCVALQLEKRFGQRVGAARGARAIAGGEFEDQHARLGLRIDVDPSIERLDPPRLGIVVAALAEHRKPSAAAGEFRDVLRLHFRERQALDFGRFRGFRLALHGQVVDNGGDVGLRLFGPGEIALAVLQHNLGGRRCISA